MAQPEQAEGFVDALPDIFTRAGVDPVRIANGIAAGDIVPGEVIRTPDREKAAYQKFLQITLPDGSLLSDVLLQQFRQRELERMHQTHGEENFPEMAQWITHVIRTHPQPTYKRFHPWSWRLGNNSLREATEAYLHLLPNYSDHLLQYTAKIANEHDPFIHPKAVERASVESAGRRLFKNAVQHPEFGDAFGGALRRGITQTLGVDTVNDKGDYVTLTYVPSFEDDADTLYHLAQKLEKDTLAPEGIQVSQDRISRRLRSYKAKDDFALALLLTSNSPRVMPIVYQLFRQRYPSYTENTPVQTTNDTPPDAK